MAAKLHIVSIRTTSFTQQKQWSVSKQGQLQPGCHPKGQVTEQTTVKWSITPQACVGYEMIDSQ